jgi:hypothetical protein
MPVGKLNHLELRMSKPGETIGSTYCQVMFLADEGLAIEVSYS